VAGTDQTHNGLPTASSLFQAFWATTKVSLGNQKTIFSIKDKGEARVTIDFDF